MLLTFVNDQYLSPAPPLLAIFVVFHLFYQLVDLFDAQTDACP
jgi:hypothetical protein